jgi:hypothetical protein
MNWQSVHFFRLFASSTVIDDDGESGPAKNVNEGEENCIILLHIHFPPSSKTHQLVAFIPFAFPLSLTASSFPYCLLTILSASLMKLDDGMDD